MIEYYIKICLNKKRKEKVNHQFLPNFPEFFQIYLNLMDFFKSVQSNLFIVCHIFILGYCFYKCTAGAICFLMYHTDLLR